ncbi:CtsR family transcriptional regulator [Tumebacillus sp. ITR2]|uniref:Transcriptional regulator CtsR n=1 Tax=Tumebacillus amylolyticus TaxID=2801339 RepID=A0ABS1JGM7_9BACL|nr:CtsR family transcriptional regulator [Tumebacillus amylolyticus]MBL0389447.1 CtsR family transcriptional regulator [Tumebacillus amylolyticus]
MRNISDIIEQHLKTILTNSHEGIIEIKRSELADTFHCVPSQINYVISTRFTIEKGYVVESKRGGGGYIRIQRVGLDRRNNALHRAILDIIGSSLSAREAEGFLGRLLEENVLTEREVLMMRAVICSDILALSPQLRDQVRANQLSAMLVAILKG